MAENFHQGVNRALEAVSSYPLVSNGISAAIRSYTSRDTLAGIHSGVASSTLALIEEGVGPLTALRITLENQSSMTEKGITAVYAHAALGGGLELISRIVMKSDRLRKKMLPPLKKHADQMYSKANWRYTSPEVKHAQKSFERMDDAIERRKEANPNVVKAAQAFSDALLHFSYSPLGERWVEGEANPRELERANAHIQELKDKIAAQYKVTPEEIQQEISKQNDDFFGISDE